MRVGPFLTASILVTGLAACGGGGGPGDLTLGPPTSPPVTTTTSRAHPSTSDGTGAPGRTASVARARFSRLAVFSSPDAPRPERVLVNPWRPDAVSRPLPQILLVDSRRADGWVKVLLPVRPGGTTGWVRAFDVTIVRVAFRIRVALGARRITVFDADRVLYTGPIAIGAAARPTPPGRYYLRRSVTAARSATTDSPYVYRLVAAMAGLLPLGTPVDIVA